MDSAIPYGIGYSHPRASSTGLPGYSHALSLHLSAASTESGSVQLLGFDLHGSLTPAFTLYATSVRQAGDLPPGALFPTGQASSSYQKLPRNTVSGAALILGSFTAARRPGCLHRAHLRQTCRNGPAAGSFPGPQRRQQGAEAPLPHTRRG